MNENTGQFTSNSLVRSVSVKAPGKCLLTGGYLILDANQKGLSVSVDAYTKASLLIEDIPESQSNIHINSIDLCSEWIYSISDKSEIEEVS